jgi:hypothetical protein
LTIEYFISRSITLNTCCFISIHEPTIVTYTISINVSRIRWASWNFFTLTSFRA